MNAVIFLLVISFVVTRCFTTSSNRFGKMQSNSSNKPAPTEKSTEHVKTNSSQLKIIDGKAYYEQTFTPIKSLKLVQEVFSRPHKNGTQCQSPNKDYGFCTSIQDCPVLYKVRHKEDNQKFINNSQCYSNQSFSGYCCGKYENYKYLLPKKPLPKTCGFHRLDVNGGGKVIGGTEATLGEFPWLARIMHTNNEGEKTVGCEGFLIHKRFVLTAAHCVRSPRIALIGNITEIQLGEHNTLTEEDCIGLKCADPLQTMKVKSIIPHPDYRHNSRDHHYDIALIYLRGEAKFSEYIQPICLSKKPSKSDLYWISGWGKTENGTYSNLKLKVSIPPFDITECHKIFSKLRINVGQSQYCAGGEKDKDSCVGDSGGPLMFLSDETRWYAAGIVSFGVNCGLEGWPGIYTHIPFFYDWIIEQIIMIREPRLMDNKRI